MNNCFINNFILKIGKFGNFSKLILWWIDYQSGNYLGILSRETLPFLKVLLWHPWSSFSFIPLMLVFHRVLCFILLSSGFAHDFSQCPFRLWCLAGFFSAVFRSLISLCLPDILISSSNSVCPNPNLVTAVNVLRFLLYPGPPARGRPQLFLDSCSGSSPAADSRWLAGADCAHFFPVPSSVTPFLEFENSHNGNFYPVEIDKCYKSGHFFKAAVKHLLAHHYSQVIKGVLLFTS